MNCHHFRIASLAIPFCVAVACGQLEQKTTGQVTSLTGYQHTTLTASVINESTSPVDVVFLNNGPHAGGCDSKSYVAYKAPSKKTTALSESWDCSEDQWFYIEVRHPKASFKVKGQSARVICSDAEGCRALDVN